MSFKTKILSLLLLGLLILPAIIGPRSNGSVLGIIENKVNLPIKPTQNEDQKVQIEEIGSGAFETKIDNQTKGKIYKGKAILNENTSSQISSDKFSLGKGINVATKSGSLNLVVGDVRVLDQNALIVLDKKTFESLGGDISKENYLDVSITTD